MQFVWDEAKRQTNLDLHQVHFEEVYEFDWDTAQISPTYPSRTGRQRLIATGWLHDDLVTIIISPLGTEGYSVISMRSASRKERRAYEERQ
jgi:uncharacterized DUF497 family protein